MFYNDKLNVKIIVLSASLQTNYISFNITLNFQFRQLQKHLCIVQYASVMGINYSKSSLTTITFSITL